MTQPLRSEAIEALAKAADPVGWAWYDKAAPDHPAKPIFLADQLKRHTAALSALVTLLAEQGYKVAPVVATEEMRIAAINSALDFRIIYATMLAAAVDPLAAP